MVILILHMRCIHFHKVMINLEMAMPSSYKVGEKLGIRLRKSAGVLKILSSLKYLVYIWEASGGGFIVM